MNLIDLAWGNIFYYHLRTQSQLGYVVIAQKRFIDNLMVCCYIFKLVLRYTRSRQQNEPQRSRQRNR